MAANGQRIRIDQMALVEHRDGRGRPAHVDTGNAEFGFVIDKRCQPAGIGRSHKGFDFEVDRKQVILEEPLKALGTFQVPVRLHSEVEVEVEVRVEREEA